MILIDIQVNRLKVRITNIFYFTNAYETFLNWLCLFQATTLYTTFDEVSFQLQL